ncbi:MAG: hypothetical protein K2F87_05115 [Muribaculaceae bacterium]|nr:hypothetical protein [Muribaculaceae bacterium]
MKSNHGITDMKLYTLPLFLAVFLPAAAQLHESVSVEGTYLKDILHPERINQLPRLSLQPLGETGLEYATDGVAAAFTPLSPIIDATAWGAERRYTDRIGYLDLSAGSWLNSALYFGAGILRQPDQRLDIRLQHNSTSLWKPLGDRAGARFSYDENLGLSYARSFADTGLLTASAQYHVGYFNYYGIDPDIYPDHSTTQPYIFPTQTLNDAAVRVGWESANDAAPLDWRAMAAARYFGYRTGTRETDICLEGGLAKKFGNLSRLGIDATFHTLVYGEYEGKGGIVNPAPDSYSALTLKPFYKWQRQGMSLRIGADLDLTFNADGNQQWKHFGALHAAPDVRFDLAGRNAGFYIHLLGGTQLHTLAAMAQTDPYCCPHLHSTEPVYTPLDANIGVELTPFRGFSAGINLRYTSSLYVPMDGWYMATLSYGPNPMPGMTVPAGTYLSYGQGYWRYNLSGFGASLKIAYTPSRVFTIHALGSYTPQRDKTGIFNGLDRPRWVAEAGFDISPVNQFSFGADFTYRGVRRIYTSYRGEDTPSLAPGGAKPETDTTPKMEVASLRLPDICRLSAHAVWNVTPDFSIRVEADNLLNRREILLPMTPTEGITVTGGLQWLF